MHFTLLFFKMKGRQMWLAASLPGRGKNKAGGGEEATPDTRESQHWGPQRPPSPRPWLPPSPN